ncbi:MAG TPA: DUF5916 domain-containing protein [Pyrinomonadaceae bacterium]
MQTRLFTLPLSLLLASSILSVCAGARAQGGEQRRKSETVRVPRFGERPVIDGRLEEEVWKHAAVLGGFYQTQPGDNTPPTYPTEVLLGYDPRHLYIAFRARDQAAGVRATVAKRDAVFDDDYVCAYLDTFNDRLKAYALYFNPLGVQADGILTEGRGEDLSVDIVMESKGVLTADGYTVEVAIPFKSLRYKAGPGRSWGVHFQRRIKRLDDELDSWMSISRDESGFLNQAGHLTGLEDLDAGRALELIPTLTLSESGRRVAVLPPRPAGAAPTHDPGRFVGDPVKQDVGLTAKLGITPDVTLDFAVNPDFAQVEADETVVTANQRFPIFFQEKRPFFLEGIDIFQTPLQPVHTRTIIAPDLAVKLTGKRGRDTFGLLFASDSGPGSATPAELSDPAALRRVARFLGRNAYVGVLRLKRETGEENYFGLTATSYNFVEKHNQLAGFDGRFRLGPQTVLFFQALGTTSRRFFFDPLLNRNLYRTGNGFGYVFGVTRAGRRFVYDFGGEGRTRDYRADAGFTRRADTNFLRLIATYNSEPKPKALLVSWRLRDFTSLRFDWSGRTQSLFEQVTAAFNLRRRVSFSFGASNDYERLYEWEFGAARGPRLAGAFAGDDPARTTYRKGLTASFSAAPGKRFSGFVNFGQNWGAFDLDRGAAPRYARVSPAALRDARAPLDPGPGSAVEVSANFTYQPTNALRASLDYSKSSLRRYDTGRLAFSDNIFSLRATYQFTRFTFARARLDYTTLGARVRGQYIVGWTPNPGTSLYAGYNDDLSYRGFSPFTGQFEPGFRRNGRTFFVKMSYLFRRDL